MPFPSSLPAYAGFVASHTLSQDQHASQHNSEQADITAVATKVGTGASTPSNNTVLRGNGAGTTTYDQVHAATDISGILGTANGGTGSTSASTGTGGVVLATSPTTSNETLSGQPTISDFTNSNHTHASTSQGGTLNAANALQASSITGSLIGSYSISRNNNGSNTTETTSKIQTGWGAFTAGGTVAILNGAITFPVAFTNVPIVVLTMGGDQASGSILLGSGGNNVQGTASGKAYSITTTGFTAYVWANSSWTVGNIAYFQWIAIGV